MGDIAHVKQLDSEPVAVHPAYKLISALLLEHCGIVDKTVDIEDWRVLRSWFCPECMNSLQRDKLPKLSLANDMWTGPIPDKFANMTVTENMLIALKSCSCVFFMTAEYV